MFRSINYILTVTTYRKEKRKMSEKVILVLVDGMRPDGMMACGNSYPAKFVSEAT